jgi:hypothetical protein
MLTTGQPLPFSVDVLDAYVMTLAQAYEANGPLIDPELGHSEGAFRYLVYQTVLHFLPGNLRGLRVGLEEDNNALVLIENGNRLRAYPIGRSELDDPWTSFPTNRHGAPAAAAANAQLPLFRPEDLTPALGSMGTNYILGHCGTSLTGLRAVHLCLPVGRSFDETVRRWHWLKTIYRADSDQLPLALQATGPIPPAPTVITPPPTVTLRELDDEAKDAD